MSRILISAFALACACMAANAAPLTPEQALQRADNSGMRKIASKSTAGMELSHTFSTTGGTPAVYVFNKPSDEGFLLLSADDVAAPVLGYADSGEFDLNNMPPQMKWWIGEYTSQIAYVVANDIKPAQVPSTRADLASVGVMIKSKWNQSAPYNNLCPTDPSTNLRCVTGCVATAMAQVMNFWKSPTVGKGSVTYTPSGFKTSLTMNFANTTFDWANMLDTYVSGKYNTTQSNAVATLMKACGYSVYMGYSSTASGAQARNVGSALMGNFGYNKNISYEQREYYTTSEWNQMVYDELSAGRPVLYTGVSNEGGHEFVCDGYSDGFFHINWGWGGMSDGYFKLEALNPEAEGIGGGSGGYARSQTILKGVQVTECANPSAYSIVMNGSVYATTSGLKISPSLTGGTDNGIWNMQFNGVNFSLGYEISPVETPAEKTYVTGYTTTLNGASGFRSLPAFNFPSTLKDGKYMCRVSTLINSIANSQWTPIRCMPGMANYFYVTKSGSSLTIEKVDIAKLTMVGGNINGDLYYECNASVSVEMENNSTTELTSLVVPVIQNAAGYTLLEGSAKSVSLAPGEKGTETWITVFNLASGQTAPTNGTEGYLVFKNQTTGAIYDGVKVPVSIKVNSSVSPSVSNMKLTGCERETINGSSCWIVTNPDKIDLTFSLANRAGFFAYPLSVFIGYAKDGYIYISKQSPVEYTGVTQNKVVSLKGSIGFAEGEDDEQKLIGTMYEKGGQIYLLQNAYFMVRRNNNDPTAVNELLNNDVEEPEYYDLQGRRVMNPENGIYIMRKGGKTSKVVL